MKRPSALTKIAFVSDAVFPFNKGGKETRIYHLTRELVRQGYQVDIYTMRWWNTPGTYRKDGVTYHAISPLYPLYAGERRSMKQGLLFGLACLRLLRYDFDILDVDHMPFFPLYFAKIVSLVKRKPMYATWHEVWGKEYWQEYLPGLNGRIAALIERLSVRLPDHIVAVSGHTADRLRTLLHYRGPISQVTNGIDYLQIAGVPAALETSDVIFVGRLLTHKNVDLLIRAVAQLKKSRPNIRCLIVGDGPEFAALQQLVRTLKLEDNVRLTGFIEANEDKFALMKSSQVFVLPSVREGFGITVLEAYACGLKIVTVRHRDNAAQFIAPKEASIVCAPSVAAIARSIDRQLEARAAGSSEQRGDVYDWSYLAAALKEVYVP